MSSRPSIAIDAKVPADGGEHPNKFKAEVSVHLRASWPPLATDDEIFLAMRSAYSDALEAISVARSR